MYETLGWSVICLNSVIVLSICLTVHIFIHSCLHLSFSATYSIHRFLTVTIHRYDSNHPTGFDSRNDLWKVHSDTSLRRSAPPRSRESIYTWCNYPLLPRKWVTIRRSVSHCCFLDASVSDARTLKKIQPYLKHWFVQILVKILPLFSSWLFHRSYLHTFSFCIWLSRQHRQSVKNITRCWYRKCSPAESHNTSSYYIIQQNICGQASVKKHTRLSIRAVTIAR